MKKIIVISFFAFLALAWGCNSDSPVQNEEVHNQTSFVKIHTAESGGNKFEVWSSTSANFLYGYNNLGVKVYISSAEQNTGFVKMIPTMYHGISGQSHSIPVSEKFFYDTEKGLFTGYAIFTMFDIYSIWAVDFNYNGAAELDSSVIQLLPESKSQLFKWNNSVTQREYVLTLIDPNSPRVGLNTLNMMLHESANSQTYYEVESAEMFIRPWMEAMGHGSGNNVNPVYNGGGRYSGTVNFTMAGEWFLYDSIKVNSSFITGTPPPKFIMEVN